MKRCRYLIVLSISLLFPQYSLAIYGVGDYSLNVEYFEKKLQKLLYTLNLEGKQNTQYFNLSTTIDIDIQNKKQNLLNKQLSIYNKLYNLELGDISLGMNQLIEPNLNLVGMKFTMRKKSNDIPTFFIGKSSTGNITGMKTNRDFGTKSSHSLFLFNKSGIENKQVVGGEFKTYIQNFSLLTGEYFLDSKDNKGFFINNLFKYKKLTCETEYSNINRITTSKLKNTYERKRMILSSEYSKINGGYGLKLSSSYKTKKGVIEGEYSIVNHANAWRLSKSYKSNNFWAGGSINKKQAGYYNEIKRANVTTLPSKQTFQYTAYAGYGSNFLQKFPTSISYHHSFIKIPEDSYKDINDAIYYKIGYFDIKSQISMSASLGVELATKQKNKTQSSKFLFKRGLRLSYPYYGFKPYVDYNLTTTRDTLLPTPSEETTYLSYGVSKNITTDLSASFNSSHKTISNNTYKPTKEKSLTINYRFPNFPITLMTKSSWLNDETPKWNVSVTYKKEHRKDTFKYKDEITTYTTENQIKFGEYPKDIVSISKEVPSMDELLLLGSIKIRIFKDTDLDGVFSEGKDIPLKDINVKLDKTMTLTDPQGKAEFIEIPSGTYTLSLDLSALPINLVCKTPIQQEIKIQPGEDIQLNFPIIPTAKAIEGVVFIDKNKDGIFNENEKGAEDVVVYANEKPTYTNQNGRYRFKNIMPGTVTVRVDVKSLPENFYLTTKESLQLNILPNQKIDNINFGIVEKEQEIEFD